MPVTRLSKQHSFIRDREVVSTVSYCRADSRGVLSRTCWDQTAFRACACTRAREKSLKNFWRRDRFTARLPLPASGKRGPGLAVGRYLFELVAVSGTQSDVHSVVHSPDSHTRVRQGIPSEPAAWGCSCVTFCMQVLSRLAPEILERRCAQLRVPRRVLNGDVA